MQPVFFGKAVSEIVFVLVYPFYQIISNPDVQSWSIVPDYIYKVVAHGYNFKS